MHLGKRRHLHNGKGCGEYSRLHDRVPHWAFKEQRPQDLAMSPEPSCTCSACASSLQRRRLSNPFWSVLADKSNRIYCCNLFFINSSEDSLSFNKDEHKHNLIIEFLYPLPQNNPHPQPTNQPNKQTKKRQNAVKQQIQTGSTRIYFVSLKAEMLLALHLLRC